MFDIYKFYQDYGISHITEGHTHAQKGWVNTVCPFCTGNPGYHLGYHEETGVYNCWRCGSKRPLKVIKELSFVSWSEAKAILVQYKLRPKERKNRHKTRVKEVKLPVGCGNLTNRHKKYLISRKYDPDKLKRLWNIKGTNHIGNYKWRIIAPIYFKKEIVSYQGRDITRKNKLTYKACPQSFEVIDHKKILYGIDNAIKNKVIVTEGLMDVWRLGYGGVCTFGAAFTWSQVLLLNRFKNVFIFFDSDQAGINQSKKLASILAGIDHTKHIEEISISEGDPGELSQIDADYLMKDLKLK